MGTNKVPSIEEYKVELLKVAQKHVKEVQKSVNDRIQKALNPPVEDYSELVREKIERDGLSYSSLKRFNKSPRAYVQYLLDQKAGETVETESTRKGSVFDCILTEPQNFDKYFYIAPKVARRSNADKALYELYQEMAGDRQLIYDEELNTACDMVAALKSNIDAKHYLDEMRNPQKKFIFTHRRTGLKIRGVIDWEGPLKDPQLPSEGPAYYMELKSAADASDQFGRKTHGDDLWYQGQRGVYNLYYRSRFQFPDQYYLVQENNPPYDVNVFKVPQDLMDDAVDMVEALLTSFKYCLENNLWNMSYDYIRSAVDDEEQRLRYSSLRIPHYLRFNQD